MKKETNETVTVLDASIFGIDCPDTASVAGVVDVDATISDKGQLTSSGSDVSLSCPIETIEVAAFVSFRSGLGKSGLSVNENVIRESWKSLKNVRYLQSFQFRCENLVMSNVSSRRLVIEDTELRGEIVECSRLNKTAKIRTGKGEVIKFRVTNESAFDILIDSLLHATPTLFRENRLVLLKGKAIYGTGDKISRFIAETVEKLTPLDPIYRMEQLSVLEDNWDHEGGLAPNKVGIEWLTEFFRRYPPNLRPPYISPWEENIISVEWNKDNNPLRLAMDIDLDSHMMEGVIRYSDGSKETQEVRYNLDNEQDVNALYRVLEEYGDG